MLKKNEIEPQAYRDAMARFAGAVHVVTTDGPAGRRGTTVIATCSVSDTPPTVLVCLNRENRYERASSSRMACFALNTLPAELEPLAAAFSGFTGLTQPRSASRLGRMGHHLDRRADPEGRARRVRLRD